MKTDAAVAPDAKKPPAIVEVDLDGPCVGDVLVEIMSTRKCQSKIARSAGVAYRRE